MTRTACPTCTRRLIADTQGAYLCPRCGTTGKTKPDGSVSWDAKGDGSPESRQARTSWKQDVRAQMRAAGAREFGL